MTIKRFLIGAFVFIIIFVFVFAGFKSPKMISKMGHKNVAFHVEDEPIFVQEVQMAASNYLRQVTGSDQAPNAGHLDIVKQMVTQWLVELNMLYVFGKKQGLRVTKEEIKDQIKKMEVFFKDGKFSMSQYRDLLKMQHLTPEQFEKQIIKENLSLQTKGLMSSLLFSESFIKDVIKKESKAAKITMVELDPKDFKSFVVVSEDQVKEYLQNHSDKVQEKYQEQEYLYNQKEKYSLGLLTSDLIQKEEKNLTYDEFVKIHQTHSGKFQMVNSESLPFEILEELRNLSPKQVKKVIYQGQEMYLCYDQKVVAKIIPLEQVQHQLAKEILQDSLTEEQEKMCHEIKEKMSYLLKNKDFKALNFLMKQYHLSYKEEEKVSIIDEYYLKDLPLGFHEKGLKIFYIHEFLEEKKPFNKEKFQQDLKSEFFKGIKVTHG